jgi:hypothetical protein
MAKAYRTKADLAIPVVVSQGDDDQEVTTGETYNVGSIVREEQLSKFHRKQLEEGRLDDLFEPVSDEEAEEALNNSNLQGAEPEYAVFVPEHEAERTALQIYGHAVVPREQFMEVASAGEQHFADHMAQVKEQGLDRRPVQEHMAQVGEQRVPDELLTGGETGAGVPYNRGPAEMEPAADEYDEGEVPTTRAAPNLAPRSEAGVPVEGDENHPGETGQDS